MRFNTEQMSPTLVVGFRNGEDIRVRSITHDEVIIESPSIIEKEAFGLDIQMFDYADFQYKKFRLCCKTSHIEDMRFYKIIIASFQIEGQDGAEFHEFLSRINRIMNVAKQASADGLNDLDFLDAKQPKYPFEEDAVFSEQYQEHLQGLFSFTLSEEEKQQFRSLSEKTDLAISISGFFQYIDFFQMDFSAFKYKMLTKLNLQEHELFTQAVRTIYIGNEFCHNLFPAKPLLEKILAKAHGLGLKIVISYPYLLENSVESVERIIQFIDNWCIEQDTEVEFSVNDWGMLGIINEQTTRLKPILGRLLNKRKKDSRVGFMWGFKERSIAFEENNLNTEHLRQFLLKHRIERYEFESHKLKNRIPEGNHSLHFPFYQINTSVYCPLYAECTSTNRSDQRLAVKCQQYCNEFYFSYPKHLDIFGFGNSIIGVETSLLQDSSCLDDYIASGIDRIVLSVY